MCHLRSHEEVISDKSQMIIVSKLIQSIRNILSSKEMKIFLVFFVVYAIFIHWNGWNENSRFFLTRSMVDKGSLSIDDFANQTSDRLEVNNHYYSDKDPGASLFASIPYAIYKQASNGKFYSSDIFFLNNSVGFSEIYDVLNPSKFILNSMVVTVLFTSVFFSALTLVLIYKITSMFTDDEIVRFAVVLTMGLATTIFTYALVYTDNAIAGFFGLLGFYLLMMKKKGGVDQKKYSLLSGLCFGVAAITSIFMVAVSAVALVYLVGFKNKRSRYLLLSILGFAAVGSVYLIYNLLIFGNPIAWHNSYLDKNVFVYSRMGVRGFLYPNFFIVYRLLLDPYKGILLYYPVILLAMLGLFLMRKNLKAEAVFILLVFVVDVLLNSTISDQFGGGDFFGPKYMTYFVPFVSIPLTVLLDKRSKFIWILLILLFVDSFLINLSGLRPPGLESLGPYGLTISSSYISKLYSFDILVNPLHDYYLPSLFGIGPQSRIIQTISNCDGLVDIRQPMPIYPVNCTYPIEAQGSVLEVQNTTLNLCACSQNGKSDGVIFSLWIDNSSDSVSIPPNSCVSQSWNIPFADNMTHEAKIVPGVYGSCENEGILLREVHSISYNSSADSFPLQSFDFRNSLEEWSDNGTIRYTTNGTELDVGNCNSSSSISKDVAIPKNAKVLKIRSCADYAGGDGTIVKVTVDNTSNILQIGSNLCQDNVVNINSVADGKNHTISVASGIKGNCEKEAPKISWIKIYS